MSNHIGDIGQSASHLVGGATQARTNKEPAAGAQAAVPTQGVGETVSLTAQARQLQATRLAVEQTETVDSAKVARVRAAIADGSYRPDSGRIVDGLLRVEGELFAPRVTGSNGQ